MPDRPRLAPLTFQLDVLFKGGARLKPALTHGVGPHGLFVRTDEQRPLKQLVRFTVVDPSDGRHLELMGIVTQVVSVGQAGALPPGIELELFGNPHPQEAHWAHLVRRVGAWVERGYTSARFPGYDPATGTVRAPEPAPPPPAAEPPPRLALPARPASPAQAAPAAAAVHRRASPRAAGAWITQGDTVRRQHVRRPAARFNVTVRPKDMEALASFGLKDISEGGTFVLAGTLLPVGTRVSVKLVHPLATAEFVLAGEVVRGVDSLDPTEKGMGIRFDHESVDVHAWVAFLRQVAPVQQPEVGPPPVRILRRPHPPGDGRGG